MAEVPSLLWVEAGSETVWRQGFSTKPPARVAVLHVAVLGRLSSPRLGVERRKQFHGRLFWLGFPPPLLEARRLSASPDKVPPALILPP